LVFNNNASTSDTLITTDGFGRNLLSQTRQGYGSSNFDTVQYTYDANGRPYSVSIPCSAAAGKGCSTKVTTTTYDGLSRPKVITDGGQGTVTYTYSQNDVLMAAASPSVQREFEYDGLGRLSSVCEINTGTGSGTCGQKTTPKGYWTEYSYNALGRLTAVTQNAQGTSQSRHYYYDALGRLTKEVNPENGTTQYFWDAAPSVCYPPNGWTTPGDLGAKQDAAGIYTCYAYDGLHRLQGLLHRPSSGCSGFIYDSSTPPAGSGITVQNTLGRLVEAYTNNDCNGTQNVVTDRWLGYSPRGEVTDIYSYTPHSGGYYHLNKTYWANGGVETLGGIPGVPNITYGVDGEGRPSTVSASSGQNPITQTLYNAASQVTSLTYGSGDSDTYQYDPNTGRMTQYSFKVNGSSVIGNPAWNTNGTLQKLQITQDPFNPANVQTCTYGYDALARINSASCGSVWGQTFSYDPFGNITKAGSVSWACATCYNTSTNQYNSTLSTQIAYDADGRLTNDTFHTYQWNAEGHPVVLDGINSSFDALGNLAEQDAPTWNQEYVYDENNMQIGGAVDQSTGYAYIRLPGGAQVLYSPEGSLPTLYMHADWLGSARLHSTQSRTVYGDTAFAPFGETYANTNTSDPYHFAAYPLDFALGLYDTAFREYHTTQGRWITPDPAGIGAVDPSNPQSWNRYAYALNNPLSNIDPTGLDCVYLNDAGNDIESVDQSSNSGECASHGGYWVDGGLTDYQINSEQGFVSLWGATEGCGSGPDCGGLDNQQITSAQYGPTAATAASSVSDEFGFGSLFGVLTMPLHYLGHMQDIFTGPPTVCVGSDCRNTWNVAGLQRLHSEATIRQSNSASYDYWSKKSTQEIIDSLKADSPYGELTINANGTVMDGNTRILVLEQRGVNIGELPFNMLEPGEPFIP
jgi:RHS repeat-associated protein